MKHEKESGQILLIAIMLLAVALTVVLTISFTSKTDTQVAKLEEENQKTLAAAEAGIEEALRSGTTVDISTLSGLGTFSGSVTIDSSTNTYYDRSIVKKDQSRTFYLGSYDQTTTPPSIISPPSPYNVRVYYGGSEKNPSHAFVCDNIALEISIISGLCTNSADCSIRRFISDPGNKLGSTNIDEKWSGPVTVTSNTTPSFDYRCSTVPIAISSPDKLMLVKYLVFDPTAEVQQTNLRFDGNGTNLPVQSKIVTADATSKTGARKVVELIQDYPQIPADIFDIIF